MLLKKVTSYKNISASRGHISSWSKERGPHLGVHHSWTILWCLDQYQYNTMFKDKTAITKQLQNQYHINQNNQLLYNKVGLLNVQLLKEVGKELMKEILVMRHQFSDCVLLWYRYCWLLKKGPVSIQFWMLVLYFNTIHGPLSICIIY